jgi:hypothetical protein
VLGFKSKVLQTSSTAAMMRPLEELSSPTPAVQIIIGPMICPRANAHVIAAVKGGMVSGYWLGFL